MGEMNDKKKPLAAVVSCVFPPEPVVSARTSQDIAAGLAGCGYEVMVVAPYPSRPGGRIYPNYRRRLLPHSAHSHRYTVTRTYSIPSAKSTRSSRFIENISFGISSAAYLLFARRPKVIYANSWPVFASGLLSLVAGLRRIPYVVVVQDVYPESYYEQGRGDRKSRSYRLMRWIDQQVARRAAHVVVLSEAFARTYREDRGVPASHISIIPNWAEKSADLGEPAARDGEAAALRHSAGVPADAFAVAYGGNIGVAAGVETLMDALNELEDVHGLVAGEGSSLSACRVIAQGNRRVHFITPWPAEQTVPLYRAADVLVLPTQGNQSLSSVPSKLIHYMLSGRPVIAAGLPGSEMINIIETSGCGWWVPPDQPQALAEKIRQVRQLSPEELRKRGEAGRRYAMANFTSQTCLPKVIHIIERAAK